MGNKVQNIVQRFRFAYGIILIAGAAIIVRTVAIQFINPPESGPEFYRTESIRAKRGSILATDGRPLAISIPYYRIRMDCVAPPDTTFDKEIDGLAKSLSSLFKDKSASSYKKDIMQSRRNNKRYKLIGNRTIDYSELERLREFPVFRHGQNKGGLIVEQTDKRTNPYGRLAYRTIGYMNTVGEGVGIEESYDYYLKGKNGSREMQKVLGQEWIPVSLDNTTEPEDGLDVRTTIDIEIQEIAENALKEQLSKSDNFEGATAVVMEVKTGAVRAIVNMKKLSNGKFDESFNYAIGQPSEPGSTFKLATLISLLEDGYVELDTPVDVGNGRFTYYNHTYSDVGRPLGKTDVLGAFEHSSNVGFVKMATTFYGNNERQFVDRIMNMKITDKLDLDIKASGITRMLYPTDKAWNKLTLPSMAIGYAIDITPMHTLTFYNAVANNGRMMKPYFIEALEKNGKTEERFSPKEINGSICSQSTIRKAKKALVTVVNGQGKKYGDSRYLIAGKTGTARILLENGKYRDEKGYVRHQASFAGFFPADNPKYSAIVVLYSGKTRSNYYGGAWATPVFKKIADEIYAMNPDWEEPVKAGGIAVDNPEICGGIAEQEKIAIGKTRMADKPEIPQRGWVAFEQQQAEVISKTLSIDSGTIPDVRGFGLKDAIYLLENEGYEVTFKGFGVITGQSPAPGSKASKKQKIELILSEK